MSLPAYTPAEANWRESIMINGWFNADGEWVEPLPGAGKPGRYNQRERAKNILRAPHADVEGQRRRTLKGIRDHGPISAVQLAARIGLQRGRVQRALHHLHDTGKLTRSGDCSRTKWEAATWTDSAK